MTDKKPELNEDGAVQIASKDNDAGSAQQSHAVNEDEKSKQENIDKTLDEPATKKSKVAPNEVGGEKEKIGTKRLSTTDRTTKEGEELLKELGHKDDNPDSDRRRTRSQTRGMPPPPPPIPRKEKVKNASNKDGSKGRGRGRPKKSEKKETKDEENEGKKASEIKVDEPSLNNKEEIKENKLDENEIGNKKQTSLNTNMVPTEKEQTPTSQEEN